MPVTANKHDPVYQREFDRIYQQINLLEVKIKDILSNIEKLESKVNKLGERNEQRQFSS